MSKKIGSFLIIFFVFVLAITLFVGVLPSPQKNESFTDESDFPIEIPTTNEDPVGGDIATPAPTLSWPNSDAITNVYLTQLTNGKLVYDQETGQTNVDLEDSTGYLMILPFTFPDEEMVVRLKPAVQTLVWSTFWHTRNGSLPVDDLTTKGVYQSPDGSDLTSAIMKENFHIYTREDIQTNLQQPGLTDEQLNQLIDLLVCQGCFFESGVNQFFYWHSDWKTTSDDYLGNRICMRYSVSVPQDIRVSVDPGYEYILYMFESTSSYFSNSTVGWTSDDDTSFVIPANTPFCIALRPEGLGPDYEGDRDSYEYLYTDRWMDIIDFQFVK